MVDGMEHIEQLFRTSLSCTRSRVHSIVATLVFLYQMFDVVGFTTFILKMQSTVRLRSFIADLFTYA